MHLKMYVNTYSRLNVLNSKIFSKQIFTLFMQWGLPILLDIHNNHGPIFQAGFT